MKTCLFSHFYNEEYLLPCWLRHHVPMFDHGVMFDYESTDRSVEIIRELAPHWEVRPSINGSVFYSRAIEKEIIDAENELSQDTWKIILNTTEFLLAGDLRKKLALRESENDVEIFGIITNGAALVDLKDSDESDIDDVEFVRHHTHGICPYPQRYRLLHKGHYQYEPGRHIDRQIPAPSLATFVYYKSEYVHMQRFIDGLGRWFIIDPTIITAWSLYAPMNRSMIERKLQIGPRIPKHLETMFTHDWDEQRIRRDIEERRVQSRNLLDNENYKRTYDLTYNTKG